MKWLSRFTVDKDLASSIKAFDSYSWHKRLWDFFPGMAEDSRTFLWRCDEQERGVLLWILSENAPSHPHWMPQELFTAPKQIGEQFLQHEQYRFDIRVNATKCISLPDENGVMPRHGKRVPLVKETELAAWLNRKGNEGGFTVLPNAFEVGPVVQHHFRKGTNGGYHAGVVFRGTLKVTDRETFSETYRQGIGSAKGFGFGMFLLAPVN